MHMQSCIWRSGSIALLPRAHVPLSPSLSLEGWNDIQVLLLAHLRNLYYMAYIFLDGAYVCLHHQQAASQSCGRGSRAPSLLSLCRQRDVVIIIKPSICAIFVFAPCVHSTSTNTGRSRRSKRISRARQRMCNDPNVYYIFVRDL